MRAVNLGTVTDMLSWYRIWPLNGFNLIRAKRKLLRRRKGPYESFSSRRKSRKSIILTIHWNLANPLKTCHGIIVLPHSIDPTRMVLLKSGAPNERRDVGWFCGMLLFCARCPRPLADGKTPYERRPGEPFEGPVIPCGAMVEYHPISAKDQSRPHQFGEIFFYLESSSEMHCSREQFGEVMLWTRQKSMLEGSMQRKW